VCRTIFDYLSCLYKLLTGQCSPETAKFQILATINMLKATDSDHHCHELDNPTDCKSSFTLASLIATTEWRSRNQIVQILQSVRIADSADCCNSQSDTVCVSVCLSVHPTRSGVLSRRTIRSCGLERQIGQSFYFL